MLYIVHTDLSISNCVILHVEGVHKACQEKPFPFCGQIMLGNLDRFNLMTGVLGL